MTTRSISSFLRFRGSCARLFIAAVCLVMFPVAAFSQTTAGLTGIVTDSTGSALPGAKVTVTSTETGAYEFTLLQPGYYALTVEKSGFAKETREGIRLEVNQAARLDFPMHPGSVSESVEVTSAVPVLETSMSSVGQVIETKSVSDIELPRVSDFVTPPTTKPATRVRGESKRTSFIVCHVITYKVCS
jgi:hypothetical protein